MNQLASGSQLRGRAVFLLAPPASGAELVAEVLSCLGVAPLPAPSHLFDKALVRLYLGYLMRSDRDGLGPLADEQQFLGAARRLADAVLAESLGEGAFVEYTPEHAMVAGFLVATYPDARFVEVVRDGRAVTHALVSGRRRRHRWPLVAARHWAEAHRRIDDVRASVAVHRVQLEQLLDAPQEIVRELALAAGSVPGDDAVSLAVAKVDAARARWLPALDPLSTAAVEEEAPELLERFGYGGPRDSATAAVLRSGWRTLGRVRTPARQGRAEPPAGATERGATRDALLMDPLRPGPAPPRFDGQLVVILGAPRSGTTWLEELLLAHPDVTGLPEGESRIFWALAPLWRAHQRADDATKGRLVAAVRAFCDELLGASRERSNGRASHFVEKTPAHAQLVSQIAPVYPDAWYLHIVRDGRDVARSLARMELEPSQRVDVAEAAHEWTRLNRLTIRDAAHVRRYRMVRYEDLLVDPVKSACELLEWVGLGCDDDLRARLAAIARIPVSQHSGKGRVGAGKWREDLSDAQLQEVYGTAGGMLVELGYLDRAELAALHARPRSPREALARHGRELAARASHPVQRMLRPLVLDEPWLTPPAKRRR